MDIFDSAPAAAGSAGGLFDSMPAQQPATPATSGGSYPFGRGATMPGFGSESVGHPESFGAMEPDASATLADTHGRVPFENAPKNTRVTTAFGSESSSTATASEVRQEKDATTSKVYETSDVFGAHARQQEGQTD